MKKTLIALLEFLALAFFSATALAQVDPTSSLLLKPSAASTSEGDTNLLDNGRYVVKPSIQKPPTTKIESHKSTPAKATDSIINVTTVNSQPVAPAVVKPASVTAPSSADRNFTQTVEDVFLGGNVETIGRYKEKLQPDDSRQNILSFSVAPSLFYIDSSSAYWFRNLHSGGPGLSTQADIWLTPFLGLDIAYFTTLSADINGDPNTTRSVLVDHRYTSAALNFRKYFSLSKKSPSLKIGVGYNEYQMIVPQRELNRVKLQEYGLDLSLTLTVPITTFHAWTIGSEIIPKLRVNEQPTSVDAKSGSSPTSYAVKFSLGEEFELDRNNKIFWRVSHRFEKSVYGGTATAADPITGATPTGVSVTTGATMFELGYSWGD